MEIDDSKIQLIILRHLTLHFYELVRAQFLILLVLLREDIRYDHAGLMSAQGKPRHESRTITLACVSSWRAHACSATAQSVYLLISRLRYNLNRLVKVLPKQVGNTTTLEDYI